MAQHAASSQFLNDWSAIRVTEPAAKKRLAEIGGQPYIATAPLLYVFVLDEPSQCRDRRAQGRGSGVRRVHAQWQLSFHAGAERRGSGTACDGDGRVFARLGLRDSRLAAQRCSRADRPAESARIHVPGAGHCDRQADQEPAVKPRMPRSMQFFENEYPSSDEKLLSGLDSFDVEVHKYYDLRDTERPVDAFSDQIAANAIDEGVNAKAVAVQAKRQGFRLER